MVEITVFWQQDSTKTSKRHEKPRGNTKKQTARLSTIPLITVIGIVEAVPVMVSLVPLTWVNPVAPPPLLTRQNTKEKMVECVGAYRPAFLCRYLFGTSPINTAVHRERVGGSITRKSNKQNHKQTTKFFWL